MPLRVGWKGEDAVFGGSISNLNEGSSFDIEKVGSAKWTIAGFVANAGLFTVSEGCVEFRGGVSSNVS